MKKIAFYIEPEWAFGVIHYELIKQLWPYGINSFVLPWNKAYTQQELNELSDSIDYFVTTPYGADALTKVHFRIPPEKCIAVCHAVLDLNYLKNMDDSIVEKLNKISCVSEWLLEQKNLLGISVHASLTPIGINYNTFYGPISEGLNTVGYAGAWTNASGVAENKRSWLAEKATSLAGLHFKIAACYHNSFVTMAGFYKTVDAVIIPSLEEGAGLPALEAGAAGKLVISTPVGLWNTKIGEKGGHSVPIEESQFMEKTIGILDCYKTNPDKYKIKCREIQEHAKSYDWKYVIEDWVNLVSN